MKAWQRVWREGIAPELSVEGLRALEAALLRDDPRLAQGYTTSPPAFEIMADSPVEAACAVAFAGWQGDGISQVGDVGEFYSSVLVNADYRLKEHGACHHFLNWFDETPRAEVRKALLPEVRLAIESRKAVAV